MRLCTWWAANDVRRNADHVKPMTDVEFANLQVFLTLLDENEDNDRLMKAEALRELGMFEDAEALLTTRFEKGLMQVVEIICSLNQNRNAAVAEMKFR